MFCPGNPYHQWSSLSVQAQAQGKCLPELRKACGLTGLLVITEERELWEQRLVKLYAVMIV
jgi:hypothetical protein